MIKIIAHTICSWSFCRVSNMIVRPLRKVYLYLSLLHYMF